MPEVDEYGIPIKKTSTPVDEYGIPIRTKEVVVEKEVFGPLPAKTTIAKELPSFQQQQEQVRAPLKYGQAAARDRSETGKLLATTWNNFVGGAESLLSGVVARTASADPYSGLQATVTEAITGKKPRTAGEVIKEIQEAPKRQKEFKEEIYKKISGATGAIKSDYVTPEEQQQISEIDFTNRSFSDNAKALFASGGRLAFDIPVGIATGGSSYYLQSYGESVRDYDRMVEKGQLEPNPLAREFYGNTVGLITSQLEKLGIDKIFGAGPALKNIQRKAIANVFGKIAKSAAPLSAKATEKLIESEIRGLSANIKARGIKAAYGFPVEGLTEGLESAMVEGAKVVTNKIQGQEVYDEKEIVDNIGKNIFNATVAGGVYGVPMGVVASFGKNVNSSVLKDIANAKTDEDFAKIDNDLEEVFVANNYSPEEREAVSTIAKNYARIKQKLPPLTPPEVQEKVIPLIEQRDKIDEELTAKKENASNLDEAVVADETADIEMLEAKRASINDEIRSEVAGTEFKYFEQDGKFFKQLGENQPEEITKARFDIESIRQEDKQLAQDEEDAPTVLDMMDKPVIINGQRATLSQEGQTVIAKVVGKPRIIEVGNIDEIGNQKLADVGLTQEESAVTLSDTGGIVVRGVEFVNLFTDPLAAINRDSNGNVVSVNLETADGKKRTFRGATADDVAYQITLKKITEDNETRQQFEDFVESNESIKQELESGQVAEAPVEAAPVVAEQVPVVAEEKVEAPPSKAQPTVGNVESTAKTLDEKKSSLDERAKKLGYIGIKQFNAQNQLNENLSDEEKALLQEYSDFQQEIKSLKDENVIAKLSDDEFSSWSKANDITRDNLGKVVKDEEIELAAKRIRILNARGDSKNADLELKKLKESKKKENWTIESWKERFDEDIEQSEIDDINKSNKDFNESVDKAVELLQPKEAPVVQESVQEAPVADDLKNVESTAKALEGKNPETLIGLFDAAGVINGEDYNKKLAEGVIDMEIELLPEDIKYAESIERKKQLSDRLEYLSKKENKQKEISDLFDYLQEDEKRRIKDANRYVSVAYHNAKKDGSNPELVKAVEDLVSKRPQETPAVKQEVVKEEAIPAFVPLEGFDGFEVKGKEEKKERYYNPDRALAMSTIKQKNRAEQDAIIDEIGEPRDARQVAMIALMGKPNISYESYIKETGFGQGEIKTRRGRQTEVAASPFTRKEGNTIEGVAEFWWENLPEELMSRMDSQDIRNEIIDLLSTYKDQNEIREAYIEEYAPKELTDEEAMQYFSRYEEEINPIEKEWEEWAAERGEKEMALELDENYVDKLIEQYESTTKAVEPATRKEKGAGEEAGGTDVAKKTGAAEGGIAKVFEQPIVEQVSEQEAADFTKFVNGKFANPKFEQQYQAEKSTAYGFTETREQFIARKFC
jgi:hypothetical protein